MIRSNKKVVLPALAGALASLVVLVWWVGIREGEPAMQRSTASMQGHTSIESLSDYTDAAVIGTVKGIVGRETDYGKKLSLLQKTLNLHGPGIPMVYYEIDVTETIQGVTDSTIIVARMDTDRLLTEQVTALQTDQQVVLFLLEAGDGPSMKLFDEFYVTVSLDNGVFDPLPSGGARPRLPDYFTAFTSQRANGPMDPVNFSLDEVRAAIQKVNP